MFHPYLPNGPIQAESERLFYNHYAAAYDPRYYPQMISPFHRIGFSNSQFAAPIPHAPPPPPMRPPEDTLDNNYHDSFNSSSKFFAVSSFRLVIPYLLSVSDNHFDMNYGGEHMNPELGTSV